MVIKEINWSKPIQTVAGFKARLAPVYIRGRPDQKLVLVSENGRDFPYLYYKSGRRDAGAPSSSHLINTPEKRTVWVNVYTDNRLGMYVHAEKSAADKVWSSAQRVACVELTYINGEGL